MGLRFKLTAKLVKTDKEWTGETETCIDLNPRPALNHLYQNITAIEERLFLSRNPFKYPLSGSNSNESIGKNRKKKQL